jgi:outer membrane protein W
MSKKRAVLVTLCAFAGAFGAASVRADDTIKHFKIFAGPAYVAPLEEDDVTFGAVTDSLAAEEQVGWNAGFEGRITKLIGIELDYINSNQDLKFGSTTIGDTNFSPVTLTLNFHFGAGEHWDFYFGPSYAYINWSDIQLTDNTELSTNTGHGWGASVGVDFFPWEHFGFYGGLRYLDANLEIDNGPSASENPLIARLGVAARF